MVRKIALAAFVLFGSCSDAEEDATRPGALLTDTDTQNIIAGSDIQSMNGSYTTCTNRTGNWSFAVTGTPTLDNAALSVIRGDTSCQLSITGLRTGPGGSGLITPDTAIALSTTFGPARAFGSPIQFYATAAIGSVNFGGDFTISLLFSTDPRTGTQGLQASFATVTGSSAAAVGVPSPNYTLDVSGTIVTTDINGAVVSTLGNLALTAGSALGDSYVIVNGSVADTYAAINTAYLAGSSTAVTANIATSAFLTAGTSLTGGTVRSLIIAKITNGVASYQKLAITFSPPT